MAYLSPSLEGDGLDVEARLHRLLFRHDMLLPRDGRPGLRLDFDNPPAPGDTVLVVDGDDVRLLPFEERFAPPRKVWIVARVVRAY